MESALAPGHGHHEDLRAAGLDALGGAGPSRRVVAAASCSVRRRGFGEGPLTLLIHLMSAGRLQSGTSTPRCATGRRELLAARPDERELRLREFGTRQAAWPKLLQPAALDAEPR